MTYIRRIGSWKQTSVINKLTFYYGILKIFGEMVEDSMISKLRKFS